jgi:radical SAM superfamily enzyme YgiQ (UPF0313 family)
LIDPSFLLMYPPLQFAPHDSVKPDGSLSLPYLAGALRDANFQVRILDASVGTGKDSLDDTFYKSTVLPSGLIRVGMSPSRIAEEISDYDVIGITSIFTFQTAMVLELIRLVKEVDPNKLVVLGGVNARFSAKKFLDAGADLICLSEAETTIVDVGEALRTPGSDLTRIDGVAFMRCGRVVTNKTRFVTQDLDELPFPAWDLLPLERYWKISRPHGGDFQPGERIQYNAMMTSRGCPFTCSYCHISKETAGSVAGNIGGLRLKSVGRVVDEIQSLKDLNTECIFIEDDSLLAKKRRSIEIFNALQGEDVNLIDVNGVNIAHMVRKSSNGELVADQELMESMAACGFKKVSLPFESASQRILDKYASGKWKRGRVDEVGLIRTMKRLGMTVLGNYTFGYPDETFEETTDTIMMAKRHVDEGLDVASFFVIVPFPGSTLYDTAIRDGYLDANFDPDDMRWTRSIMVNTTMSADTLECLRTLAWKLVNRSGLISKKESMGA